MRSVGFNMPIVTAGLEHRVQIGVWEGIVTLDELFAANTELDAIADENGYNTYVQIIDTKQLDLLQARWRDLNAVAEQHTRGIAYIVIDGPYFTEVITKLMRRGSKQRIEKTRTLDDALTRARQIIAASEPVNV